MRYWLKGIRVLFIVVLFFLSISGDGIAKNFIDNKDLDQAINFDDADEEFDTPFEEESTTKNDICLQDNTLRQSSYFRDATFTFSHQFSYGTKEPESETITNRSFLRCEFDKSFSDIFFIRFDAKANLYFENDHIATVNDKTIDHDGDIREFYLQAGFEKFLLKAGKQLVIWGETDGDVINDVVSPRNESEFVFIDLEDSRLGNYMTSLDIYSDYGNFLFFVTTKPSVNDIPDKKTRYYRDSGPITVKNEKRDFSDNETGFKWKKTHHKFELSFMTASLLQNNGILTYNENSDEYEKRYQRFSFYGIGTSYTSGSFLFKLDTSLKENYQLQSLNKNNYLKAKKSRVSDSAFGIDYDANGRYMLNFELTNRHIFDYTKKLCGMKKDNPGLYFQFTKDYLNDTLTFRYSLYHQFQENNSFHKTEFDYSFSDNIQLTLDYTLFGINDRNSFLWSYRNEDRVDLEFQYYF